MIRAVLRLATLTAAAVLALAPAGSRAQAVAPAAPEAARAYSDAALGFARELKGVRLEDRAIERALSVPGCQRTLASVARRDAATRRRLGEVLGIAILRTAFAPIVGPLQRFIAKLEAVGTADRALVAGRDGWRTVSSLFGTRVRTRTAVCAELDTWRRHDFAPDRTPDFGALPTQSAVDAAGRRLERARLRLRALGIAAPEARRFARAPFLDPFFD